MNEMSGAQPRGKRSNKPTSAAEFIAKSQQELRLTRFAMLAIQLAAALIMLAAAPLETLRFYTGIGGLVILLLLGVGHFAYKWAYTPRTTDMDIYQAEMWNQTRTLALTPAVLCYIAALNLTLLGPLIISMF